MQIAADVGLTDPRMRSVRIAEGQGLGGAVWRRDDPMRVDDYARDRRISSDFVDIVCAGEGIQAMACVPIHDADGTPLGLLYGANRSPSGLGDRAVAALVEVATFAEVGMQNEQTRVRELELQRVRDRQRLAGELHDSVAQSLFTIGALARRRLSTGTGPGTSLADALEDIETIASHARASLRDTLRRLGAADEHLSFDLRLDAVAQHAERVGGCVVRVVRRGEAQPLPSAIEDLSLDIVREGIRNAVKHETARTVVVSVAHAMADLRIAIQSESGTAATPRNTPGQGTGMGLELLRRRAHHLCGALHLDVEMEANAVLRARFPIGSPIETIRCAS